MFEQVVAYRASGQKATAWAAANAVELFGMPDIDGGLIGGASLNADEFGALFDHVDAAVGDEKRRLMDMRSSGQDSVWWPFTQHAAVDDGDVTFIESAHGDKFRVVTPVSSRTDNNGAKPSNSNPWEGDVEPKVVVTELFDGCGSWWTQVSPPISTVL